MKLVARRARLVAGWLTAAAALAACGGGAESVVGTQTAAQADTQRAATPVVASTAVGSAPTESAEAVSTTTAGSSTPSSTATTWVECASEYQTCSFAGTRTVRYGTATRHVTKSLTGGTYCGNYVFGDPAPGALKTCWYETAATTTGGTSTSGSTGTTTSGTSSGGSTTTTVSTGTATTSASTPTSGATPSTWVLCSQEYGTCSFSGTRAVRYGTATQNVVKTFTGGVYCGNGIFGDPAYGADKSCWYESTTAGTTTAASSTTSPTIASTTTGLTTVATSGATSSPTTAGTTSTAAPAPAGGSIPTPESVRARNLPKVGRIVAVSGQVIENVHVTSTSGSCIVVKGVSNVIIRNSEIGPCGQPGDRDTQGVEIDAGASNITVERNVIHDVSSGAYVTDSTGPIVWHKNYVYRVRGPLARGQMIQFNNVAPGASPIKITCNISDQLPGVRYGVEHKSDGDGVEDHINLYQTAGRPGALIEIAYNRLRGGHSTSTSGSGIMTGDGPGQMGYTHVHNNIVVNVRNVGIGIAGGVNTIVENNRIFQDGTTVPANLGIMVSNYSTQSCGGHVVRNNRVFTRWTQNGNGALNSYWTNNCSASESGNTWGDTGLSASIFNEVPAPCQ